MSNSEFHLEESFQANRSSPINWIRSHSIRYWWLPLLVILAAVFNNFAASYIQILIGQVFDLINQESWQISVLTGLALTALGASTAQGVLGLMRNFATEWIAQLIERNGREELYVSLLGKSQTFHGRQRIGDIMARATNDVQSLNLMFSPGLMLITDTVMAIIVPLALIATLNAQLLLVPFLFLFFFVVTVRDYSNRLSPVSQAMRGQFGMMNAGLAESIGGVEVVKGNAQEEQEIDKFTHNASKFRDFFIQNGEIQAVYLPLLVYSVFLALGFFHALWMWQRGALTLGEVVAFMGLFGILRFPTFISLFSFDLVNLGIASAKRILELINTETELDENEQGHNAKIKGQVTFDNVQFGYDETAVLENINFTIDPGQTVAIVGQTGSGKTTLTRLINRIFDAQEGGVLIDGIDVKKWSLESLRSQISTIEQDIFLFSLTVAENIAFGNPDATREEIIQAAKEAQAHDFIMGFADGYETEIGERGVTLSGGQRQRLAIARAFMTKPSILILDDSTSAIDSATEDKIQQAMRRISRQQTTFLITHRLSQIRWADRILVLSNGTIADQGTHDELLERSTAYQRIFARYE
ncbi:MAG: ABC transporter ATP-binding protein [Chloroflexota bacterium]